jgi:hypothetical protein
MTTWKISIVLLFIVMCCLFSPPAHAQSLQLDAFDCNPVTCQDIEFGFTGTSSSSMTAFGLCHLSQAESILVRDEGFSSRQELRVPFQEPGRAERDAPSGRLWTLTSRQLRMAFTRGSFSGSRRRNY